MPTNPSARLLRASTASSTVRQRRLQDTVGVAGGRAAPVATVEENTEKQATDEQTTNDTSDGIIKGRSATTGMGTDMPAIHTPSDGLHGDVPSGLTKLVTRAMILLALSSPFLWLPAAVSPAVQSLKTVLSILMAALYPVLYLLGSVYLISRLLYALCQDVLKILHPTPGPLRVVHQDLLTLLELFIYPVRRLFNFIYQHLPTSLRTFSKRLPRRFSGLPNVFHRYRWLLVTYVTWLGFTYTVSFAFEYREDALSIIVCATPYVGPQLVLCQPPGSSTPRGLDLLARIALPRERLADTVMRVGRDHRAGQILGYYGALDDLKICVELSGLTKERKIKLDESLGFLIDDTLSMIPLLDHFTMSLNDTVNGIMVWDENIISVLDEVARETQVQQQETETLSSRMLAAIHPFTGLVPDKSPGRKVKLSIECSENELAKDIDQLLNEADTLLTVLHKINTNLNTIRKTATKELSDTSSFNILQDLWILVIRKKDINGQTNREKKLLGEITRLYDVTNGMMRDISSWLLQAKAGIKSYRITQFRTNTFLEVYPPHVIAATLRRSMEMLEASTQKVDGRGTRIAEVLPKRKRKGA